MFVCDVADVFRVIWGRLLIPFNYVRSFSSFADVSMDSLVKSVKKFTVSKSFEVTGVLTLFEVFALPSKYEFKYLL